MLQNYIKTAFRNLFREKGSTFLNLAGLTLGITCSLILFLLVKHLATFDNFHSKIERIYRVETQLISNKSTGDAGSMETNAWGIGVQRGGGSADVLVGTGQRHPAQRGEVGRALVEDRLLARLHQRQPRFGALRRADHRDVGIGGDLQQRPFAMHDAPQNLVEKGEPLRIKFGMADPRYDSFTVVIILRIAGRVVGIVVDGVSDVITLASEQIKPAPSLGNGTDTSHIIGFGTLDERMRILMDVERLVGGADLGSIGKVH